MDNFLVSQIVGFIIWCLFSNWYSRNLFSTFAKRPLFFNYSLTKVICFLIEKGWIIASCVWFGIYLEWVWSIVVLIFYWFVMKFIAGIYYKQAYQRFRPIVEDSLREDGKLETSSEKEIDKIIKYSIKSSLENSW